MFRQTLTDIVEKFKVNFYSEVFKRIHSRETSLTTVEAFCVETIYALKNPTINQFANFIEISSPNAAYKVSSLINKGYIRKVQSKDDKREYHLEVTSKYFDYYNLSQNYVNKVAERAEKRFSPEDLKKFDEMMQIMRDELMAETKIPSIDLKMAERAGKFDD